MKKSLITLLLCLCCSFVIKAQTNSPHVERPRLVIGIVVDQMRWDYLTVSIRVSEKEASGA